MSNVVITEGDLDKELTRSLFGDTRDTSYIAAGGWSGVDSLARSWLTDPNSRVVIVVDADSINPADVAERRRFLDRSLGQIADSSRWRVLVVAPEIEGLLFHDKSILESLVQRRIDDTEFSLGQSAPRSTLERISGVPMRQLFSRLSAVDLEPLRKQPEIQDIRRFLRSRRKKPVA